MGAGAVGAYCGAHMVREGEDVTFVDPWPEHVVKMREGLHITGTTPEEEFTVPVRALHLTEAQQLSKEAKVDIAFVCMKSYDTAWATLLISQYLAPGGFVVSLQIGRASRRVIVWRYVEILVVAVSLKKK